MIKSIEFIQYKKLKNISFPFEEGLNAISGENGTCKSSLLYKPVDKLSVPWKTRKQQLEQIHNELGIGISYDAYPEQYVGWAPREAFRDKVLSLSSGFKPIFVIG